MDLDSLGMGVGGMAYVNEGPKVSRSACTKTPSRVETRTDDRACTSDACTG